MWRMHASMHMGAATISMAGFPSSLISQLMPALDTDWPPLLILPTNSTTRNCKAMKKTEKSFNCNRLFLKAI
jgi:hypothetical protein